MEAISNFSLTWFVSSLLILSLSVLTEGVGPMSLSLGCFGILFFISFLLVKTKSNLRLSYSLINLLLCVFLPLTVFQTGGVNSPMIFLYLGHCVFALATGNKKGAALVIGWSCLNIVGFGALNHFIPSNVHQFFYKPGNLMLVWLIQGTVVFLPALTVFKIRRLLFFNIREKESQSLSSSFFREIEKETMSKVKTAEKYIENYKQDNELKFDDIDIIEQSLRGVDKVIKTLSKDTEHVPKQEKGDSFSNCKKIARKVLKNNWKAIFHRDASDTTNVDFIRFWSCLRIYSVAVGVMIFGGGTVALFSLLTKQVNIGAYVAFVGGFFLWGLARRTMNIKLCVYILFVLNFLNIVFRIHESGGIFSPAIIFLFTSSIVIASLGGLRLGIIFAALSYLATIGFGFVDIPIPPPVQVSGILKGVMFSITMIFLTYPLWFLIQERIAMEKSILELERKQNISILVRRVNHEVGNSLNIALGYLELSKEDRREDFLEKALASIKEIEKVLKEMKKRATLGGLMNILREFEEEVKILKRI